MVCMKEHMFKRTPWCVKARVNDSQLSLSFKIQSSAIQAFDRYMKSFTRLDGEAEVQLFNHGSLRTRWFKGEHESMGKLSAVYEETSTMPPFLTAEQKSQLADERIEFMVDAVKDNVSKLTGNKQHIFTITLKNSHADFAHEQYAFSLDSDTSRATIAQLMTKEIRSTGFYGPVFLKRNGRYYLFEDAD